MIDNTVEVIARTEILKRINISEEIKKSYNISIKNGYMFFDKKKKRHAIR